MTSELPNIDIEEEVQRMKPQSVAVVMGVYVCHTLSLQDYVLSCSWYADMPCYCGNFYDSSLSFCMDLNFKVLADIWWMIVNVELSWLSRARYDTLLYPRRQLILFFRYALDHREKTWSRVSFYAADTSLVFVQKATTFVDFVRSRFTRQMRLQYVLSTCKPYCGCVLILLIV